MKWAALCLSAVSVLFVSGTAEDVDARSRRSQGYESRSQHYDSRRQERREARSERRSERSRDYYRPNRPDRAHDYGAARETRQASRIERRGDNSYRSGWTQTGRDRLRERQQAGRAARLERRSDDGYSSGWTQTARERLRERQDSGRAARLERRGDDRYRSGWTLTARERLRGRQDSGRAARLERRGDDRYRSGWTQTARERLRDRRETGRAARVETRGSRSVRQPEVYIDSRYVPRQSYGSATAPSAGSRIAPRAPTPALRYATPQARSRSSVCGNYTGSQRTSCLQAEVRRGAMETARVNRNNQRWDTLISGTCKTREAAGYVTSVAGVGKKILQKAAPRVIRRKAGAEAAQSYAGQITGIPTSAFEVGARAGDSVAGNPNACAPRAR
jgi:hypothetical protein